MASPQSEYARRLEGRRSEIRRLKRRDGRLVAARAVVVAAALALAAWTGAGGSPSWRWMALPGAVFVALVVAHEAAHRSLRRALRSAAFHEAGIARGEERWEATGPPVAAPVDEAHPYAADLDLFGRGSLFERLDRARTAAGEEALASWILGPAPPAEVRERQRAVAELLPRLDLREDVSLLGEDVRAEIRPDAMTAWGEGPPLLPGGAAGLLASWLPPATLALIAAWAAGSIHGALPSAALAAQAAFAWVLRSRVQRVVAGSDRPARDLRVLSQLLGRLERERFESPLLRRLGAELRAEGLPPSACIRRLAFRVDLLDARRNQLFAPVAALAMWTTSRAFRVEAWRGAFGRSIGRWIRAAGEIEALLSLAGYAFERPDDPFPEIADDGPLLDAEGLGHPSLPDRRCVRNPLRLDGERRLLVVSGSNMSGKSTLLRAVGTNVALALAGAPVRARRMRLSPLRIVATIRIQDSLRAGTSRFYAEILRLRKAVGIASEGGPVLFLFDELLEGTNSDDRAAGAEAVLGGLLDRGAIGLVTTHDLALAAIADGLAPRADNAHFEDRLENGRLLFDYRLLPGVVRRGNALELMRSVGLEV